MTSPIALTCCWCFWNGQVYTNFECGYDVSSGSEEAQVWSSLPAAWTFRSATNPTCSYFNRHPGDYTTDHDIEQFALSFRKGDRLLYFYRFMPSENPFTSGDGRVILKVSAEEIQALREADRLTMGTVHQGWFWQPKQSMSVTKLVTPILARFPAQ